LIKSKNSKVKTGLGLMLLNFYFCLLQTGIFQW
jgi:hypothetical protein